MPSAFYGAYGWGGGVTGGRGGAIREVTNLNTSGAGSFEAACANDGPAIVVFRVGGVIDCSSYNPLIAGDDLTIAGQTSPGGGITFDGGGNDKRIRTRANNLIIRYLSLREVRFELFNKAVGVHDIIIDQCSASWGHNDMFDIWYNDAGETDPDIENITVQNCIIAQGLTTHPTGMIIGGGATLNELLDHTHNISVHNNLFVNVGWRNPKAKGQHVEIINNVIYNWSNRASGCGNDDLIDESDWIGNYWLMGNMSSGSGGGMFIARFDNGDPLYNPESSIYIRDNLAPDASIGAESDNWPLVKNYTQEAVADEGTCRRGTQLAQPTYAVPEVGAAVAFADVPLAAGNIHRLDSTGNFVLRRDTFDQGEVDSVVNDDGGLSGTPASAGATPTIDAGTAYTDTDGDGMADDWEDALGLDKNDDTDGPTIATNGYSNVENFINGPWIMGSRRRYR